MKSFLDVDGRQTTEPVPGSFMTPSRQRDDVVGGAMLFMQELHAA